DPETRRERRPGRRRPSAARRRRGWLAGGRRERSRLPAATGRDGARRQRNIDSLSLCAGFSQQNHGGTAVAVAPRMRFVWLAIWITVDTRAEARLKPGEQEFLGCNKYPPDKKFRWGMRGEVGVGELVAS